MKRNGERDVFVYMQQFGRRGPLLKFARQACLAVAFGLVSLSLPSFDNVSAETAKKATKSGAAKAAKSEDEGSGDSALQAYDAGVRLWQAGKADGAVKQLNAAIATSKLPPQQMARALYYRGLAQRKLGKPAMAFSDLQSALWLKGALTESERSEAMAARTASYREAGRAGSTISDGRVSGSTA